MSIEGQGYFFTIYFPGFVCFVLYLAKISGERLQDHWSSGINIAINIYRSCNSFLLVNIEKSGFLRHLTNKPKSDLMILH